jgi:hypothetical protein
MPELAKGKTYGKVIDQHHNAVQGLKVELWDDDSPDPDDRMGVTYTDAHGGYEFRYPGGWDLRVPGSDSFRPDMYLTVGIKNRNGDYCQIARSNTYKNHKLADDLKIDLQVNVAGQTRKPHSV